MLEAAYLSPIGPYKYHPLQAVIGWDYCDFIKVPFCAVANIRDFTVPPLLNHDFLVLDTALNAVFIGIGYYWYFANGHVHAYLDQTVYGHNVWISPFACEKALEWIARYIPPL